MLSINQYTANGTLTNFPFTFLIPNTGSVDVYITPVGQVANEVNDIIADTEYTLNYNSLDDNLTDGTIIFNTPPSPGEIITITAKPEGDITVDFTATGQLNPDNLNLAFAQHTSPIDYSFGLFGDRTLRYNINVNINDIGYSFLLPPLSANGFWRRNDIENGQSGAAIIAQDYDEFVSEVTNDVSIDITNAVNDSRLWAYEAPGVQVTDSKGNTGFSALSGQFFSNQWATSLDVVSDPQGNTGNSSRYWAQIAQQATSQAGGLIEEIFDIATAAQTTFDLVSGSPLSAWKSVSDKALSVYLNGLRQPQVGVYTLNIKTNPTVADPSQIIFNTGLTAGDTVQIDRSEPQGQGGTMNANSDNAIFDTTSLVASRSLSNIMGIAKSSVGPELGDESSTPHTLPVRDSNGAISVDMINDKSLVGSINIFAMETLPANFLACNGDAVDRLTYADLFAAIGTTYGIGDGVSTFNLPNLLGENANFIRGYDPNGTRNIGTTQQDSIRNITGNIGGIRDNPPFGSPSGAFEAGIASASFTGGTGSFTKCDFDASRVVPTSTENRPVNIALQIGIRWK